MQRHSWPEETVFVKICVIIPTEEGRKQAGVRIRYERIMEEVAATDSRLRIEALGAVDVESLRDEDICLISKCYDARGLLLAAQLNDAGKLVGVDLFDDYFSQADDTRLIKFRRWLSDIRQSLGFVLCCTPAMETVAKAQMPGLPVHMMNDPGMEIGKAALETILSRKYEECLGRKEIRVAWFGIGDNSHFPVGLADLMAYGNRLSRLAVAGFSVTLAIQTNTRALTPNTLARLRQLPVPYSLQEWSLAGEERLLADSLISFIPTNGQKFSQTKSLNRALTSLCAGTQVLSAGYPLYERLAPFIYTDEATVLEDLAGDALLLRPATLQTFDQRLRQVGEAKTESRNLVKFLTAVAAEHSPAPKKTPAGFALLHGQKTDQILQGFAADRGALTVAGPYCSAAWPVDVLAEFDKHGTRLDLWISEKVLLQLPPAFISAVGPTTRIRGAQYRALRLPRSVSTMTPARRDAKQDMLSIMEGYPSVMGKLEEILETLFPGIRCILAERSVFPFVLPEMVPLKAGE
jgi:hypothetical protein